MVESIIRLISAEAEAEALLGLAELGKIRFKGTNWSENASLKNPKIVLKKKFRLTPN